MIRVLFWCGAGSIPRLKRVTSSCRAPSWTKVRTRAVTSTRLAGTPHSAPTNSPPCAKAEPANRNAQAKAATATIADLLFIVLPLFLGRIITSNEQGKHLTEVHELECERGGFALRYEPDLAWMRSILAPLRWPEWSRQEAAHRGGSGRREKP